MADFNPAEQSHRRYNPLLGEWVLVSPHRTQRPWQGQQEAPEGAPRPAHDPTCYLCPGNVRAGGAPNPAYTDTFVFDNDFAALQPGVPAGSRGAGTLLHAEAEAGRARVVCFSPRHDLTLPELSPAEVRRVVDVWTTEYRALGADPAISYVQIFENKGFLMGCSNPHPHGQIWAQRTVPGEPAREGAHQAAYYAAHGRSLLADYLAEELAAGERVVLANDTWVALVPFWAVWPFETLLLPRRPAQDLTQLSEAEKDDFADLLRQLTIRYDNLFHVSFPYSAGLHQQPTDGQAHPGWHLHMHFYPPLLRSATVRKFMVGYELLGDPQRDITPEAAAARLRAVPATHYKESIKKCGAVGLSSHR